MKPSYDYKEKGVADPMLCWSERSNRVGIFHTSPQRLGRTGKFNSLNCDKIYIFNRNTKNKTDLRKIEVRYFE